MIKHIKLSGVKPGDKFKNYDEFCKALELSKKNSTREKTFQFQELKERFMKFHKEKRSFVIDEIYEEQKEYKRKSRSGRYANYGKPLIVDMLKSSDSYEWEGTQIELRVLLGMIKENSHKMVYDDEMDILFNEQSIKVQAYKDFSNIIDSFVQTVNSMLSALQHEGYIEYEYRIDITLKQEEDALVAKGFKEGDTEKTRVELYDRAQSDTLEELGYKNFRECKADRKTSKYNAEFKKYIREKYTWEKAQKKIHISLTDKGYDEAETYLHDVDVNIYKEQLNTEVIKRIREAAEGKREKAIKSLKGQDINKDESWGTVNTMDLSPAKRARLSNGYIESIEKLISRYVEL